MVPEPKKLLEELRPSPGLCPVCEKGLMRCIGEELTIDNGIEYVREYRRCTECGYQIPED